jgi:endonuclease-8
MPEGDTLHRAAATLSPYLEGHAVRALELPRRGERVSSVVGKRVTKVEARGKNLLVHFENGIVLHTHLKMNGLWRVYAPLQKRPFVSGNVVVTLEVDTGAIAYCWRAPIVRLVRARALASDPRIASLGPDPIADGFDAEEAIRRLRLLDTTPLGEALLDQRVIAGIGNVWKSELCFRHLLDPFAPVARFTDDELRALLASTVKGMRRGVLSGMRPHRVYGRLGKACLRCGTTPITMARQGEMNRSTYHCRTCQPAR